MQEDEAHASGKAMPGTATALMSSLYAPPGLPCTLACAHPAMLTCV